MTIKILGGFAKNFTIHTLTNTKLRPSLGMLKRRVFDANQDLTGFVFVDLCAGTGAVGLEAWSRKSSKVYLIEKEKDFYSLVKKNVERIKNSYSRENEPGTLVTIKKDCVKWLKNFIIDCDLKKNYIFFLDPPYENKKIYNEIMNLLCEKIQSNWQFWIESDERIGLKKNEIKEKFKKEIKFYNQSSSYIAIIK
jgi:16S rRNA (guanine966-N2)-methyltransferase